MDKLKDMFERLPKWAKIGVPVIIVAGIAYYIYKNKSSASSTLTEPATGAADTSADSGLPSTSPDTPDVVPPVIPTPVTPSPKHNPQKASPKEIKLSNHWAAQAAKNARAKGVKTPTAAKANKSMTEAQVTAAYQRNKGAAAGIAAKKGKK
jgi:hypothetical protein